MAGRAPPPPCRPALGPQTSPRAPGRARRRCWSDSSSNWPPRAASPAVGCPSGLFADRDARQLLAFQVLERGPTTRRDVRVAAANPEGIDRRDRVAAAHQRVRPRRRDRLAHFLRPVAEVFDLGHADGPAPDDDAYPTKLVAEQGHGPGPDAEGHPLELHVVGL